MSPCLAGTAAGLEMAAAVTCADVSTIDMVADRYVFRAAVVALDVVPETHLDFRVGSSMRPAEPTSIRQPFKN